MPSVPPPSSSSPGAGTRETVIAIEAGRRRHAALRVGALGAVLEHERALVEPLRLPLGALQLAVVERGAAKAGRAEGRFPVLRRLSASAVLPREQGIEGWLWTSSGGSGLTSLGDEGEAPNAALLFTAPLTEERIARAFAPPLVSEIAARSPLGAPAVYGVIFRVTDPGLAETTFRRFGLLKPLTDREVPPTLRRSLPTDRAADPRVRADAARAPSRSVAPPGAS